MNAEATYLVGRPIRLPEELDCQGCGKPSAELALVWKIVRLRDAPDDPDGRRYFCPSCVGRLGPRGRLIPPPEEMAAEPRRFPLPPLPPLPAGVEPF